MKYKVQDFVVVSADLDDETSRELEGSVQGLPCDISSLGSNVNHAVLIEKFSISETELKLNDGLVAAIYNKIALRD